MPTTYLLDTNAFLFLLTDKARLSAQQQRVLADPANSFRLSAASVLEIVMLHRKGKINIRPNVGVDVWLPQELRQQGIRVLPVTNRHALRTATLPRPHRDHNDPMDLLIIAQALVEGLPVVSTDGKFPDYQPAGLRVID